MKKLLLLLFLVPLFSTGQKLKSVEQFDISSITEKSEWKKSKTILSDQILIIKFRGPFKPRRGRINCSLNDNGKWRWFGIQFPIKEN